MKVICINDNMISFDIKSDLITIGKIYEANSIKINDSDYYDILSHDGNKPGRFLKTRFMILREYNLSKLI
jgi:hypothetical protein